MGENKQDKLIRRVLVAAVLYIGIFLTPWFFSIVSWIIYGIGYKKSFEVVVAGFVFDILYTVPVGFLFFPATIGAVLYTIIIEFIRPRIAFFSSL